MNARAKQKFEEERELLLNNEEDFEKFPGISYPVFETAIAKGVANHVGKWPSHLFAAFLAASLVFAAFVLFALVTAGFCVPTVSYRCRVSRNFEFTQFPNVYFVKVVNRTWSREELCYVESSALDNPEIIVYLINLLSGSQEKNSIPKVRTVKSKRNEDLTELLTLWEQANNSIDNIVDLSSKTTPETRIRLAANRANVRNVDVTIDDFFKGSMLARVSHKLDRKTLEIAAKAYLLWNTSGVALSPSEYRRLGYIREYLCKKECKTIKIASINPEGSVLASGVPCQAFVGYLIHEIALNGVEKGGNVVKEARGSFCKRLQECSGLKILNKDSRYPYQSPSCPTIYPSGFPLKNGKSRSNQISKRTTELKGTTKRRRENIKRVRQIFI